MSILTASTDGLVLYRSHAINEVTKKGWVGPPDRDQVVSKPQGIEGNEVADEWAKLAADEPDAHGVEWFSTTDQNGAIKERRFRFQGP